VSGEPPNGYRRPRVAAAGALIAVAVGMLILDPFMPGYTVSDVQLAILLTTAGTLLGVEIIDVLRGKR
jgi:hypothetical protein